MLRLETKVKIDLKFIESPNICDRFTDADLERLGIWAHDNYIRDLSSREDWLRRTEAAMDLAMQVQKAKSFPWNGCSNVKFPLVTIAAMQFHARAYPAIINGRKVVATRVVGEDPTGAVRARADRISNHMSWQLLEQDESWEEEQDRGLLNVSIVGVGWKKSFYDASQGYNRSQFIMARNLVVNYWAKSIDSARTKTEVIPMWRNDLHERMLRGTYRDCTNQPWYTSPATPSVTVRTNDIDNRAGATMPASGDDDTPFTILEQHCWIDLDGDGYEEPYILTFEEASKAVVRLVARFDRIEDIEYNARKQIVKITATEYYTKMPFVPSPDGSIMDVGFGQFLGPLNDSVNSAINQLFDAGTMTNTAGGFLGRGAKLKGGIYEFKPFSWNRVDATGDDLRKNIYPLPVREPSKVMFNLLTLLIDYTNRVAGSTDMMVGENPGQNTPAGTAQAMLEQGQKIYSAIFKRVWRGLKNEFKKIATLNAIHLPSEMAFGETGTIRREDYAAGAFSVIPVADPTIASDGARFAQARMVKEAAAGNPGYDIDAVERFFLQQLGVDDAETLYPGQASMPEPAPDIKVQIQAMKNEVLAAQLEQKKMEFVVTMQETVRANTAKIAELMAKAMKYEREADSEPAKQNVAAFRAGIEAMREQNNQANSQLDRMMEEMKGESGKRTAVSGVEATSSDDPLASMGA
jgi:chaperonin GroES